MRQVMPALTADTAAREGARACGPRFNAEVRLVFQ
jgi:hypothetical protein